MGVPCSTCPAGLCNASIRNAGRADSGCACAPPTPIFVATVAPRCTTFHRRSGRGYVCARVHWAPIARPGVQGSAKRVARRPRLCESLASRRGSIVKKEERPVGVPAAHGRGVIEGTEWTEASATHRNAQVTTTIGFSGSRADSGHQPILPAAANGVDRPRGSLSWVRKYCLGGGDPAGCPGIGSYSNHQFGPAVWGGGAGLMCWMPASFIILFRLARSSSTSFLSLPMVSPSNLDRVSSSSVCWAVAAAV